MPSKDSFVVHRGSRINPRSDRSAPDAIKKQKMCCKIDEDGVLLEDVRFTSPSSAAAFVTGSSTNGRIAWKTDDGRTLKDVVANAQTESSDTNRP